MANIVICADGTWNRPEEDLAKDVPTNVLRLARAIKPTSTGGKQHVFYDWGLGSYHSKVLAGGLGCGIHKNIEDGYRYIVQNYAPGDKLYFFGFSRGAYTVRALCGLINNCGILKRNNARLFVEAWRIYKNSAKQCRPNADAVKTFRSKFCHQSRNVHFVGVWDTVGALGIPFSLMGLFDGDDEFYNTKMGGNVAIARHALAIDEQREDFEPTIWKPRPGVDLKQVWFAGVHSDVGGSYPPDKKTGLRASDVPLQWMMREATAAGLGLESYLGAEITDGKKAKLHKSRKHIFRAKRPKFRSLINSEIPLLIHPSVKFRYQHDANYRPRNLKALVEAEGWNALPLGS